MARSRAFLGARWRTPTASGLAGRLLVRAAPASGAGRQQLATVYRHQSQVGIHHAAHELFERHLWLPPEGLMSFLGIADEEVHFRGTHEAVVLYDVIAEVEADVAEGELAELAHR